MNVLILNSGIGKRMGQLTSRQPKCMTMITDTDSIISRQLKLLKENGITDIVITTGYYHEILSDYCEKLSLDLNLTFVNNPKYAETNYIYSIDLAKEYLADDLILMHGDLVFSKNVLKNVLECNNSCMTISTTLPLPEKDFKAVLDNKANGDVFIKKVGIEFFQNAVAAQPLYKLLKADWLIWKERIEKFCINGDVNCYAENALNEVTDLCNIIPVDYKQELCNEIDTIEDLDMIQKRLKEEHR